MMTLSRGVHTVGLSGVHGEALFIKQGKSVVYLTTKEIEELFPIFKRYCEIKIGNNYGKRLPT